MAWVSQAVKQSSSQAVRQSGSQAVNESTKTQYPNQAHPADLAYTAYFAPHATSAHPDNRLYLAYLVSPVHPAD